MEFHVISNSKQTDFIGKGRVIEREDVESVDSLLTNMINGCALVIASVIQDIGKSQAAKESLLDVSIKALRRAVENQIEPDTALNLFDKIYQKWFESCSYMDESKLFSDVKKYNVMPCLRYNAAEDTILVRLEGKNPASGFCETIGSVPKKLFDENHTDALAKIREFNLVAALLFIRIFGKNKESNPLIADDYIPLDKKIPSFLRSISNFKFVNRKTLTAYLGIEEEVVVPDGITSIYCDTFWGDPRIKKVILPAGLSEIKANAFRNCINLEEIFIPESVTIIERSAFWHCEKLKSISLPPHLTTISESLFSGCHALEAVAIPDSVTNIEEYAFSSCYNLKSLILPPKLTIINNGICRTCSSLETVVIPDSVTMIGDYAFESCYKLKALYLPLSLTTIGNRMCQYCSSLETVFIPNSVTAIGSEAFSDCPNLKTINDPQCPPTYESILSDTNTDGQYRLAENLYKELVHMILGDYADESDEEDLLEEIGACEGEIFLDDDDGYVMAMVCWDGNTWLIESFEEDMYENNRAGAEEIIMNAELAVIVLFDKAYGKESNPLRAPNWVPLFKQLASYMETLYRWRE